MEAAKRTYSQKKIDELLKAVLMIGNLKEARMFFRDLCTLDELKSMSERWEIATLLSRGLSYRKVAEDLNVSTTTVSRVASWLYNGKGGYASVIKKVIKTSHSHSLRSRRKS